MGIFKRYVLSEVAWPAILAMVVVSFVGVANELRSGASLIPFAYATVGDLARMMLYFLPTLLHYLLPMAYMMGILMAFGRLSQQNEITAMKAAGIPLKRVLLPILLGGVVLSGLAFLLQDRVQPLAQLRVNKLIYEDLLVRATLDVLPAGVMHKYGDWRVYIGDKVPATKTLKDVDILIPPRKAAEPMVLSAKSAQLEEESGRKKIVLKEAYIFSPVDERNLLLMAAPTATQTLPTIETMSMPNRLQMQTLGKLLETERKAGEAYDKGLRLARNMLREVRQEIAKRIAFPLACLAVSLVAAPLAVRSYGGGRSYSYAAGFVIALTFYLLYFALEPRSLKPLSEVILRSLTPGIVLSLTGLWLLWRVDRV